MKNKFTLYLLFILIFLSGCIKRTQEENVTVPIDMLSNDEDPYMKLEYVKDAILLFDAHLGRKNPYLFEFEKNGESKLAVKKTDKFRDIIYMPTTSFCYANDSVTYFYHQFEDRIYGWNYNSNETFVAIDLFYENGKSISGWDEGIKLNGDSKNSEYQTLYDNREYVFGIKNLYNLSNCLFFTVEDRSVKYCMRDPEKNKLRMSSNLVAGLPDTRLRFFEGPDETLFAIAGFGRSDDTFRSL